MELRIDSLNDLPAAAETLLRTDPAARHFAFYGGMGAGKTTFIKALCQVLGVRETVTSPTFALVNEYHTAQGQPVYHFDFYRIRKVEELYDLGCEEYFDEEDAYCMIEWPGLAEEVLPEDTVCVHIEQLDDSGRLLSF